MTEPPRHPDPTASGPSAPVHLRPATPAEAGELSAIALAAKAHWGYPASALAAWGPQLTITAESIARHPTFVCEADGAPAGFCQLAFADGRCTLENLWVRPECMGRGLGSRLLAMALAHAVRQGARQMEIDADPNAEGFYLAHGAVRTGMIPAPVEGAPDRIRPQLRLRIEAPAG